MRTVPQASTVTKAIRQLFQVNVLPATTAQVAQRLELKSYALLGINVLREVLHPNLVVLDLYTRMKLVKVLVRAALKAIGAMTQV